MSTLNRRSAKKRVILVLVDGNNRIGMGHVIRQIILSKKLQEYGFKLVFVTLYKESQHILRKKNKTILVQRKSEIKKAVNNLRPTMAIIDKLTEDTNTIKFLCDSCNNRVCAIDYTARNGDLIPMRINILYPQSGVSNGSVSGFSYAIINPKFRTARVNKIRKKAKTVLVIQGGADTRCFIPKIVESLKHMLVSYHGIKLYVIVGPYFCCDKKLQTSVAGHPMEITILRNVKDLSEVLGKVDIAITAGGNTLLELSCAGIPCIVICAEKFEEETASVLEKEGACINLGFGKQVQASTICKSLASLIDSFETRNRLHHYAKRIVDGKGDIRVSKLLLNRFLKY